MQASGRVHGDHVVAAMPFGFRVQLLTVHFQHVLWILGIRRSFSNTPTTLVREDVYEAVEKLRRFRNRVTHYYAIFDMYPLDEYANAMRIIDQTSSDLHWYDRNLVNPQAFIAARPR